MKNFLINLRSPAGISLLLVIPFMFLEWANRREFDEAFPIPLFIIMWLLPMAGILTAKPILQNMRAGNNSLTNPVWLLLRLAILVTITWVWTGILIDQMPCFLGVANCD